MSQHGPKQGIVRNVVEFFFGPPAIEARVAMLERQVASLRQAIPQTQAGSPPAATAVPPAVRPVTATSPATAPPAAVAARPTAPEVIAPSRSSVSFEEDVIGTWFPRVGAMAVLLGAGFGFKYAIDRGWIGPTLRVLMGLLLGCALIGLAEWTRSRKWNDYAHAVAGGGVGVIYLSAWVAFHLYGLLSPGAAFTALLATSMLGVGLSLRHDSQPLSFLAVLGAYVAPSLIGDAEGDASALYLFVLAVDVAVLTLAALRHWTWLTKLAFTASWFLFGLSISTGEVVSGAFATMIFVIFATVPLLHRALPGVERYQPDFLLIGMNALVYYLTMLTAVLDPSEHALFTASMVGVYAALGTGSHLAFPQHRGVAGLHGALAIFFITIWGHLALSGQAVISYWALEALVLFVLASVTPIREFRAPGGVVLGMAAMGVLFRAGSGYEGGSLVNAESAAFASVIAVMAGVWWLLRRDGDEDPVWGRMLTISAHVLTVVWLTVVTEAYLSGPVLETHEVRLVAFAFSTLWALYATALLTAGVVLRSKDLRVLAVVLFGLTVGKMAFSDLWLLETGQRLIGFIGIGGLLLGCSLMFHRFKGLLLDEPASSSAPVVEAGL